MLMVALSAQQGEMCVFLSKHVVKILNLLDTHSERHSNSKIQKALIFYGADSEGHCVCVCACVFHNSLSNVHNVTVHKCFVC